MNEEKKISDRYAITPRTVRNWNATGAQCGVAVPWADPEGLLEWYRAQIGREPSARLKDRVAEMLAPELVEGVPVEVVPGGNIGVPAIAAACEALGLSSTLARIVDEEDRAWAEYQAAREKSYGVEAARRNWKEATEAKRAVHKTDDAVMVALKLLKGWTRGEWEPRWKALKIRLGGVQLGQDLRDELLAAKDADAWATVWDRGMERAVLEWSGDGVEMNFE